MDERVVFWSEEVDVWTELSVSGSFIVGHIFEELFASQEEDVGLVDLQSGESRGKVERIREKVRNDDIFPFVVLDIVFLDIHLFVLGDTKTVNMVIKGSRRLMGFNTVEATEFIPFFSFEGVADAATSPLILFDHSAY